MNLRNALRSEDTEQINVIAWADWNAIMYPELRWLHHIPNGGSRNKAEAVKFKQMGVRSGVSDLCLPYPKGIYHGLYIEMKYGSGAHKRSSCPICQRQGTTWQRAIRLNRQSKSLRNI